jgi:hypothetical protein
MFNNNENLRKKEVDFLPPFRIVDTEVNSHSKPGRVAHTHNLYTKN